jgi:hypothetical protein
LRALSSVSILPLNAAENDGQPERPPAELKALRSALRAALKDTIRTRQEPPATIVSLKVRTAQPYLYVALAGVSVAVATCSQAIWFGEVMRMERSALYLRGLEQALSSELEWKGISRP